MRSRPIAALACVALLVIAPVAVVLWIILLIWLRLSGHG